MSQALQVLGQAAPAVSTLTALYTVPASTQATVSTVYVCNQNSSIVHFRVSVAVNGAADTPAQYLYYNCFLLPNNSFAATVGLTLNAGDVVRVYTDMANVSFSAFGVQVT